jgi:trehalose 6-phosphate phosphatase
VFAQDSNIALLLEAPVDGDQLARRPVGRRPAAFLDHDGTLTPGVDRSEDALIAAVVDALLAHHATEPKVTPCKVVYEIQPGVDGDKGSAGLYLLEVLGLDGDDVIPLYPGGDIADEHDFEALGSRGVGILVADDGDPELGARRTAVAFMLRSLDDGERFRRGLARDET